MGQSKTKIYAPLVVDLAEAIGQGRLMRDQCLPSENDLGRQYGISRVSVRAGLRELEGRGLICRRAGKGTFVADINAGFSAATNRIVGFSCNFAAGQASGMFFGPVCSGIQQAAEMLKLRLEFINENTLTERAPDLLGYIGVSFDPYHIKLLKKLNPSVPAVLINRHPDEHPFHCVTINHPEWARRAMEYILQLGHRRLALVATGGRPGFVRQRLAGVRAAQVQGAVGAELIEIYPDERPEDLNRLRGLLADRKITALFVLMGNMVVPVLALIRELGLRVPDDVSVLAFDDVPHPFHPWIPDLTAVRQPLEELGQRAVQLLVRIGREGAPARQAEFVPAELVVRESCRSVN